MIGSNTIYSQNKEKSFEMTLGMSYMKIMNNNFSPIIHKGNIFMTSIGFITETPKYLDISYLQFNKGKIHLGTTNATDNTSSSLIGGAINWVHVRKLNSIYTDKYRFYFGGIFNTSFYYHKRNSPESDDPYYLFQSSIGPAFHFRYPFKIRDKRLLFESQINTALISYVVYPSYCSIMPDKLIEKNLDDISIMNYAFAGKILTMNKFQHIGFMANITYGMSEKIYLKLSYNWKITNVIRPNNLTKVDHNISVSLIIN